MNATTGCTDGCNDLLRGNHSSAVLDDLSGRCEATGLVPSFHSLFFGSLLINQDEDVPPQLVRITNVGRTEIGILSVKIAKGVDNFFLTGNTVYPKVLRGGESFVITVGVKFNKIGQLGGTIEIDTNEDRLPYVVGLGGRVVGANFFGDDEEENLKKWLEQFVNFKIEDTEGRFSAWLQEERWARADADSAEAGYRLTLAAALRGETEARVMLEYIARVTAFEAEALARLQLTARVDDNQAYVENLQRAYANQFEAEASARLTLTAKVNENAAYVTDLVRSYANQFEAEALARQTLKAEVNNRTDALFINERIAYANQFSAEASERTQLEARVRGYSDTLITEERTARSTQFEAEATARLAMQANFQNDINSRFLEETIIRSTALAAEAAQRTLLETTFRGLVQASAAEEAFARSSADEAIARRVTTLDVAFASGNVVGVDPVARANIVNESEARANALLAEATTREALQAYFQTEFTKTNSAIDEERTVRSSQNEAFASERDTLRAQLNMTIPSGMRDYVISSDARITQEAVTRANEDFALAQRVSTIEATYTGGGAEGIDSIARAQIRDEASTRASADEAQANRLSTIEANYQTGPQVDSRATIIANAKVAEETAARVTALAAQASRIQTIEANYQTAGQVNTIAAAKVADEARVRSDADSAMGQRIQTIEGSYQSPSQVDARATIIANAKVAEEAAIRVTADNVNANRSSVIEASLASMPEFWRVCAFGNSVAAPNRNAGVIAPGGTPYGAGSSGGAARSYTVVVFQTNKNIVESIRAFDVYNNGAVQHNPGGASANNAEAMATWLNSIAANKTVIVYSADEPAGNHLNADLQTAMRRCGAGEVFASTMFFQSAYILIGRAGIGAGNGMEYYAGNMNSDPAAFLDQSFMMRNGIPVLGSGASATRLSGRITTEENVRLAADNAIAARSSVIEAQLRREIGSSLGNVVDNLVNENDARYQQTLVVDARVSAEEAARVAADAAQATRTTGLEASFEQSTKSLDNGSFQSGLIGWVEYPAGTTVVPYSAGRNTVLRTPSGGSARPMLGRAYQIKSRDQRFELDIALRCAAGKSTYYIGILFYNEMNEYVAATDGTGNYPLGPGFTLYSAIHGWIERTVIVGKGLNVSSPYGGTVAIPEGAVYFRPAIYLNYHMEAGSVTEIDYYMINDVTNNVKTNARIGAEELVRTAADSAIANRATTVEAQLRREVPSVLDTYVEAVNNLRYNQTIAVDARVTAEEAARVAADNAQAIRTSLLEARSGSGGNLLGNTELETLDGWSLTNNPWGSNGTFSLNNSDPYWRPDGLNALNLVKLGANSNSNYYMEVLSNPVPVTEGDWMQHYAFLSSHRALHWSSLFLFNSAGAMVGYTGENFGPTYDNGGDYRLNTYNQVGKEAVRIPTGLGVRHARLAVRLYDTFSGPGMGNPILWMVRPYLGMAREGQTEWNPYSPGSDRPQIKNTLARIADEAKAAFDRNAAVAQRASTLEAQMAYSQPSGMSYAVVTVDARVSAEESARVTADEANASRSSTLEAQLRGERTSGLKTILDNKRTNLALVDWWRKGAVIPWNTNGGAREEIVEFPHGNNFQSLTMPDGSAGDAWLCQADSRGENGGGWNNGQMAPLDPDKTYRFAIPIAQLDDAPRTMYWGTGGVCHLNTTEDSPNSYFAVVGTQQQNRWYLFVGYIFPRNSVGHTHAGSGVWDLTTGDHITSGANWCFHPDGRQPIHRAYQYYAQPGAYQAFGRPLIECIDGSETNLMGPLKALRQAVAADARITNEETVRVTADNALAARASVVEAKLNGDQDSRLAALIREEASARTTADQANANRSSSLETAVSRIPETWRVRAAGNGASRPAGFGDVGVYSPSGVQRGGYTRSYTVHYFQDGANVIENGYSFDVYGDPNASTAMANWLNGVPAGRTVVIYTSDEPKNMRHQNGLQAAMRRCGAGDVFDSPNFSIHSAYILIGRAGIGKGKGREFYAGNYDTDPQAWLDIAFTMYNGRVELGDQVGAYFANARVDDEASVRSAADSAMAGRISTTEAQFRGEQDSIIAVRIRDEANTRATADSSLGSQINTVDANWRSANNDRYNEINAANARITNEASASAGRDGSLSSQIATVDANWRSENNNRYNEINSANTRISNEETARANADGALGSRISTVDADWRIANDARYNEINAANARITSEANASAGRDGALGSRIDTVKATADGASSAASIALSAAQDAQNKLGQARIRLLADAGNGRAQIDIFSDTYGNAGVDIRGKTRFIGNNGGNIIIMDTESGISMTAPNGVKYIELG